MLELRTVASLARHLGRSSAAWDHKVLVLCDSLVTVGCCRKMRSSSFALLRQLRVIGAVWLGMGIRLVLRWVPTARNPADGPSRGLPVPLPPRDFTEELEDAEEPLAGTRAAARQTPRLGRLGLGGSQPGLGRAPGPCPHVGSGAGGILAGFLSPAASGGRHPVEVSQEERRLPRDRGV